MWKKKRDLAYVCVMPKWLGEKCSVQSVIQMFLFFQMLGFIGKTSGKLTMIFSCHLDVYCYLHAAIKFRQLTDLQKHTYTVWSSLSGNIFFMTSVTMYGVMSLQL